MASHDANIFDKILSGEIKPDVVYEDEKCMAFRDSLTPQAPTHIVLIPKEKDGLTSLDKAEERHISILGHLMWAASVVANKLGLEKGYRIVQNNGPEGCQSVYHIHLHILGGAQLFWPPGTPSPGNDNEGPKDP